MNLRRRLTFNRWMRRARAALPVILGVAIGAAAFAVFDQTYGDDTAQNAPAELTSAPAQR